MHGIAIVDDNHSDAELLKSYVNRFCKEENEECSVTVFKDGMDFLSDYKCDFEVVFMDIEMPYVNGINIARKLRAMDSEIALIFVTNMAQYAIEGFEVEALDFMVKPVTYFNFMIKLKKAFRNFDKKSEKYIIVNKTGGEVVKLPVSTVYYVDKQGPRLIYHTATGEYSERTNINTVEEKLIKFGFAKCRSGCMVNLRNITKYNKESVFVGGTEIPISRGERADFIGKLMIYFGKDN